VIYCYLLEPWRNGYLEDCVMASLHSLSFAQVSVHGFYEVLERVANNLESMHIIMIGSSVQATSFFSDGKSLCLFGAFSVYLEHI
jgi:hypothetical protein